MIERDAIIVGGGISGLAIAQVLSRAGLGVELWESEVEIGGKIRTARQQGYTLDCAASMLMASSPKNAFGHVSDTIARSTPALSMSRMRAS